MRSEIKEEKKNTFPRLVIREGDDECSIVVMLTDCPDGIWACGIVVYSNSPSFTVGEYSNNYQLERYKDFNGVIELSN